MLANTKTALSELEIFIDYFDKILVSTEENRYTRVRFAPSSAVVSYNFELVIAKLSLRRSFHNRN